MKVSAQTIATPSTLTSKTGKQHFIQNSTRLSNLYPKADDYYRPAACGTIGNLKIPGSCKKTPWILNIGRAFLKSLLQSSSAPSLCYPVDSDSKLLRNIRAAYVPIDMPQMSGVFVSTSVRISARTMQVAMPTKPSHSWTNKQENGDSNPAALSLPETTPLYLGMSNTKSITQSLLLHHCTFVIRAACCSSVKFIH